MNVVLLEEHLGVHPHLEVVAAQAGHILDDDPSHLPGLDVGNHALEVGPVTVGAAVPVVDEEGRLDRTEALVLDEPVYC